MLIAHKTRKIVVFGYDKAKQYNKRPRVAVLPGESVGLEDAECQ